MGTSLNGLTPQNTYPALIKVGDNTSLTSSLKTLSDGIGNDLTIQASTTGVNFTGTVGGVVSGVAGAMQFSNGSAFASDAANLFYDDTNNRLGIGTNVPSATTHIKGSGSTSATTSLLVQNSSGSNALSIKDDGYVTAHVGLFSLGALTGVNVAASNILYNAKFWNQSDGGTTIGAQAAPAASAILDIRSTTSGVLFPRMTTAQKNAIVTPAAGLMVYDTNLNKLCVYTGAAFETITSV